MATIDLIVILLRSGPTAKRRVCLEADFTHLPELEGEIAVRSRFNEVCRYER